MAQYKTVGSIQFKLVLRWQIQEDPSGNFLTLAEGGGTDYIFGTSTGVFVVDTANGAILGFQKTASKAFDASFAGTYKAVFYENSIDKSPRLRSWRRGLFLFLTLYT